MFINFQEVYQYSMYSKKKAFFKDSYESNINKHAASKFSQFLFETLEAVIYALILMIVFMTFFFRIISVSGVSMLDTLHDFDKVLISRFNYAPKCGDVVVIKRGQYLNQPLVKRIIATEGQSLKIDYNNQAVFVDGTKINESYLKEPMICQGDDYIPEKIPKGYSFVMGDNRNKSLDSRSGTVGLIENKNIVGKAVLIIFSLHKTGWVR